MIALKALGAVLALASLSIASPTSNKFQSRGSAVESHVVEKLAAPPAGWVADDSAVLDKETATLKLRIHLVHQNMPKLQDLAMRIATPGDAMYGEHLEQHVIDAMIAPKDESAELVMQWLKDEDMSQFASVSDRADSVVVEGSVSQIEKLLKTQYSTFKRTESGETVVRTLSYSLPETLAGHVDMVQPTTFFGLKSMRSTISRIHSMTHNIASPEVAAVTGCNGQITPTCLSNLYSYKGATKYTNGYMGIAGFLEQWPSHSDLTTFMNNYASEGNAAHTYNCTLINGGTCPGSGNGYPGIEANLDTQYVAAIAESIPTTYYSTGGRPPIVGSGTNDNEPYLEFLNYLLNQTSSHLPQTISISYGDDEDTVPLSYADNVCNLFMQLGARGVSVLVASGDSGVGTTCKENGQPQFTTSFPASCPWVTTVGGTDGVGPEAAWTDGGGGFSSVFGRPSYQNAAVSSWLTNDKTHTANSKYFNSSGRAYPDVAAQATDFVIVASGQAELVDGTSCATPTFASIIQLINSDRLTKSKKPLGFLNPWLYTNATSALTDITTGSNSGCSGVINGAGFNAVAGWDPATGLGTPIYTKLLTLSNSS